MGSDSDFGGTRLTCKRLFHHQHPHKFFTKVFMGWPRVGLTMLIQIVYLGIGSECWDGSMYAWNMTLSIVRSCCSTCYESYRTWWKKILGGLSSALGSISIFPLLLSFISYLFKDLSALVAVSLLFWEPNANKASQQHCTITCSFHSRIAAVFHIILLHLNNDDVLSSSLSPRKPLSQGYNGVDKGCAATLLFDICLERFVRLCQGRQKRKWCGCDHAASPQGLERPLRRSLWRFDPRGYCLGSGWKHGLLGPDRIAEGLCGWCWYFRNERSNVWLRLQEGKNLHEKSGFTVIAAVQVLTVFFFHKCCCSFRLEYVQRMGKYHQCFEASDCGRERVLPWWWVSLLLNDARRIGLFSNKWFFFFYLSQLHMYPFRRVRTGHDVWFHRCRRQGQVWSTWN